MSAEIRIRAQIQGDNALIRVLMQHPMESGQGRDETGKVIPAHFIQTFSVQLNKQPLIDGQLNTSISANPLFTFKARNLKAGDHLAVHWTDNTGKEKRDEIIVG
ncbi:thiosulfate oxidation carrier complex protein SoxZ [Azonexus sp.]|uniref:thiosulfate oxidation carrier complex protein SoxZ n=1 Tax=Azonexus sp. TaxID=1872668 RepID=UPI0035B4CA08